MAGAALVEVGTAEACTSEAIEAAIGPRTAALIYIVSPGPRHRVWAPNQVDNRPCARPPADRRRGRRVDAPAGRAHHGLWTKTGADLVILSGGKGIRGPQNTGLLVGRTDLIRAAAANGSPNSACGAPLQGQQGGDHRPGDRHRAVRPGRSRRRVGAPPGRGAPDPGASAQGIPGVRARLEEDRDVWTAPTLLLAIDPAVTGLTPDAVMRALRAGDPPIMVRVHRGVLSGPPALSPRRRGHRRGPPPPGRARSGGRLGA